MKKEIAKQLSNLIQLDIDAVHAYGRAIERIDVADVRQQLTQFQGDHERHIDELSRYLESQGETPPERARDFKGFLIEGFTALRSVTGTAGALKAMQSNEETTNKHYEEALRLDLPVDARAIVEGNLQDERRHLAYVKNALAERSWEKAA